MVAYLLERLYPAGWRRGGEMYWRLGDAVAAGEAAIEDDVVGGYRVLVANVNPQAVVERLCPRELEDA
jgi:hypothetical protein